MRVCLIIPPSGFQLDERVYPMLGVLKVAAVLEQRQYPVQVWDLSGETDLADAIWASIGHYHADVYGITATMPQMPAAIAISRALRVHQPSARIMLGGAHPTLVNAAAKRGVARSQRMLDDLRTEFNAIVCGDGEHAVFKALQPDSPFVVDADDSKSPLFLTPADVAAAPWPARHLIDLASYHCLVDGVRATSIIAQLGCPFRCGFCGGRNSPTYRRVRLRSVDDIVAELCDLYLRYGYRAFMFLDDELNVSRSFLELLRAIHQAQRRLGTEWRLCGLLKSELFTTEQADLMYTAGFRKILIGFESGDDRILLNMQKVCTVADNTRAVQTGHAAGLRIKALMSLGHPGESQESILRTRDWLLNVRPDEFDATVLTVYPGTPYHDDAIETAPNVWSYTAKSGDRVHAKAINQFVDTPYYKGIPGQYQSFVWTDHLSSEALVHLRDDLEQHVRDELGIAWPKAASERQYEHSMGLR